MQNVPCAINNSTLKLGLVTFLALNGSNLETQIQVGVEVIGFTI